MGSTSQDVLRKEGRTAAVVLGAVARHVARAVNGDALSSLGVLGLDEIALRTSSWLLEEKGVAIAFDKPG